MNRREDEPIDEQVELVKLDDELPEDRDVRELEREKLATLWQQAVTNAAHGMKSEAQRTRLCFEALTPNAIAFDNLIMFERQLRIVELELQILVSAASRITNVYRKQD